ncbi:UNKNOWN [Stylonychia lemnae]|uniref:Peroxisomal membrane protein PEX16 n=1 Tax=Stylonychia lemnae TaxID=5949 RepID=A0A078A924_STYLE|nr:UNKNOWN [Stylonychia lemnae]|eukprot:CDW78719.1 UNKNOWN [Stylonychia lemnae]
MISSRGLILHSMMYGLNVFSEIRQLQQQYQDNQYAVFYFSKALSNIGLFIEFFFEILNERCEPVVVIIEGLKSFLRLREYSQLLFKENINVFIDIEPYKEFKKLKEIKESHFTLVRSKKQLPKIPNFQPSKKLQEIKDRQKKKLIDHKRDQYYQSNFDELKDIISEKSDNEDHSIDHEVSINGENRQNQSMLKQFMNYIKNIYRKLACKLGKYHLDDILFILRPFVYVYFVIQYGRKDYMPIKIIFAMDMIAILISLKRLSQSQSSGLDESDQLSSRRNKLKSVERRELVRRIRETLLKYLIRDPIFEGVTKRVLEKLFSILRISPRLLGLLYSLLSYFRYYTYIA